MTVEAIRPEEITSAKFALMPDAVMVCWNSLIAKNFSGGRTVVNQDDAVTALMTAMNVDSRSEVFEKGWLEIEPIYRAAGWEVSYWKLNYNESGSATFTFRYPA